MLFDALVLSCEHASNRVPARYAPAFARAGRVLDTHRGYDIGAAAVARALARATGAPLFEGRATRLLVDLNRSPGHRAQFSEYTRDLPADERRRIVAEHYAPHRSEVERAIRRLAGAGRRVLHVPVHSFTPRLHGHTRTAELGLLYDPARRRERAVAAAWKRALADLAPQLRVRRNYPYRGVSDGFGPALRRQFPDARYACLEIEINQALLRGPAGQRELASALTPLLAP
jgi:predicted N-formylglutamate amidohydrolase